MVLLLYLGLDQQESNHFQLQSPIQGSRSPRPTGRNHPAQFLIPAKIGRTSQLQWENDINSRTWGRERERAFLPTREKSEEQQDPGSPSTMSIASSDSLNHIHYSFRFSQCFLVPPTISIPLFLVSDLSPEVNIYFILMA